MKNIIWNDIKSKKFKVIKKYRDDLRDDLANFGKSSKKYSGFGAFYELYLYAFAIGLHRNERVKLQGHEIKTFNTVHEWSSDKLKILSTFLMALLSIDEIRTEAEFDFSTLEMDDLNETDLKKRVNNLVGIFEEFANGGFAYIHERYMKEPENFEYHSSLQKIFEEVLTSSKLTALSG